MIPTFEKWRPYAVASLLFAGLHLVEKFLPQLRLEGFCRPAAILTGWFLNLPVVDGNDRFILTHPGLELQILPGCSGFDFFTLLAAFWCAHWMKTGRRSFPAVVGLLTLAYMATVLTNACRLICGFYARLLRPDFIPSSLNNAIHNILGIAIFLTVIIVSNIWLQRKRTFS